MSELVPREPADLRLSDAERETVARFLRSQVGEGRLTLDELEERLGAVYAARVRGDLADITADLQVPAPPEPARSGPPARHTPIDPAFRRHLQLWIGGWALSLIVWLILDLTAADTTADNFVAAQVPMLVWTAVLFFHWLRVQGD